MTDDEHNRNMAHRPPTRPRPPGTLARARAEVDAAIARAEEEGTEDGVVLLRASDLYPQPVRWLWPGWLALGKFHILAGAPGQGKTTIAMALAATVTQAQVWPDGSHCNEPGNILVWSGEDDPADTLLPRLLAAGADRARCYFVHGTRTPDGRLRPFDPAIDMDRLRQEAQRTGGVRLLVVDPVVSAVAGDSHKNTEVRRALQPLVDLARSLDAAVLGISHFSKGGGGGADLINRVSGSIAFSAMPRVVLVAASVRGVFIGPDGQPGTRRIFARAKSNIGPDDGGFDYQIEQLQALPGLPDIAASRIVWGQAVSGSARELLNEQRGDDDDEDGGSKSASEEACDFLHQFLGEDQVPVNTVREEAAKAGVSWSTLRRAAHHLCVIKTKGGASGHWFWKLPKMPN